MPLLLIFTCKREFQQVQLLSLLHNMHLLMFYILYSISQIQTFLFLSEKVHLPSALCHLSSKHIPAAIVSYVLLVYTWLHTATVSLALPASTIYICRVGNTEMWVSAIFFY